MSCITSLEQLSLKLNFESYLLSILCVTYCICCLFSRFISDLFTGAQPKAGTGHKMQMVAVVFSTLHCEGYTADLRYIACSLLLGVLAGSLKSYPPFWKAREDSQEKDCTFLGNGTFPNLYDALVYERKFNSEYLGRQIYERLLRENLPSWILSRIRATYQSYLRVNPPYIFPRKIYRESKRTLIKANFTSS